MAHRARRSVSLMKISSFVWAAAWLLLPFATLVSCLNGGGFGFSDRIEGQGDHRLRGGRRARRLSEGGGGNASSSDVESLLHFKERVHPGSIASTEFLFKWNTSLKPNVCDWPGVGCGANGRVSNLSLPNLGLAGTMSTSLGNLSFLSTLDLAGNNLHGPIPASLGSLQRLEYLDFSKNNLTSRIPAQLFNCTSLKYLNLGQNSLVEFIPPELGNLRSLSEIHLGENSISSSIPKSIGNLSALVKLDFSQNRLIGWIPEELGMLNSLMNLTLLQNNLTGPIPKSVVNCTFLRHLDLSENNISGVIFPELGSLQNLQALQLDQNMLHGSLPPALGNISSLSRLMVMENQLSGDLPRELGNLQNLTELWVGWNYNMTGPIPLELGNLPKITFLVLMVNNFTGPIPHTFRNLTGLTLLELDTNNITGGIPEWIGELQNLTWLGLRYNFLTGPLPPVLGNLTKLFKLMLSYNQFTGPVMPELGNLSNLQELGLDHNNFTGALPSALGNCHKLVRGYLSHNQISGSIPPDILSSSLGSMYWLDISHNELTGELPREIGRLTTVNALDFSYNMLSGPIPPEIGDCKGLSYLDLSTNRFSGELPLAALESLTLLKNFSIANNSLNGPVPSNTGAFANVSADAYSGNADLCGAILGVSCSKASKGCARGGCYKWIFLVCGVVGVMMVFLILWGVVEWRGRMSQGEKKENILHHQFEEMEVPELALYGNELKFSLEDLSIATKGFSEQEVLGRGGNSTVYRGKSSNGMVFALKCFDMEGDHSTDLLANSPAARGIHNELRILGNLRHRNLVKIFGLCTTPTFRALLLEFIPNGTLHEHLHKDPRGCQLSWEVRLSIAIGMADALIYLHHECPDPVIHRDLKPSNILLDKDCNARVADFGISKYISRHRVNGEVTVTGLFGTTGYIAPEYVISNRVSNKGDVYSFGVVLLEMLTGKRPTDDTFQSSSTWISLWVRNHFPDRVPEILDPRLGERFKFYENDIRLAIRVGLLCTSDDARDRPSMIDVREMLSVIRNRGSSSNSDESSRSATASSRRTFPGLQELLTLPPPPPPINLQPEELGDRFYFGSLSSTLK